MTRLLRDAKLPREKTLASPDLIDPKLFATLATFTWIKEKLDVLITGACGVGMSFVASAPAHLPNWFADCNLMHRHRALKYRSPEEFRQDQFNQTVGLGFIAATLRTTLCFYNFHIARNGSSMRTAGPISATRHGFINP